MKKNLTSLLFISFLLLSTVEASAHIESEIVFERVNPGNPFYILKRGFEKVQIKFNDSTDFKYTLLERRYKELVFVANEKRENQVEPAASRYMTQAGEILDAGILEDNKSEIMKEYIHILKESRDNYESNSAYWLVLQQSSDLTSKLIKGED